MQTCQHHIINSPVKIIQIQLIKAFFPFPCPCLQPNCTVKVRAVLIHLNKLNDAEIIQ